MCCALNHQNILEMAQGHISLSLSPLELVARKSSVAALKTVSFAVASETGFRCHHSDWSCGLILHA
jgi:hypothetical protein